MSDIAVGAPRTERTPSTRNQYDTGDASLPQHPEWDGVLVACQKGDVGALRALLRDHPSCHSHANSLGQTALHIASWWNRVDCVSLLLESGANPNASNRMGATPLHECLASSNTRRSPCERKRRKECAEVLLCHEANTGCCDGSGNRPLERLVVASCDTDLQEYAVLEQLFRDAESRAKRPSTILLRALKQETSNNNNNNNNNNSLLDRLWKDCTTSPELRSETRHRLATELVSTIEAWIEHSEENEDDTSKPHNNDGVLDRVAWIREKLVEPISEQEDDFIDIRNKALRLLAMGIFHRFERIAKQTKSSNNDSMQQLLRDDRLLASWTEAATRFAPESKHDPTDGLHQTWMTIARKDYLELAELWWDQLGIAPIGVVNGQGMTALQFAARSGNTRMVRWFLSHQSCDDAWVHHNDQRGQTALTAATANQHEAIARLLQDRMGQCKLQL